MFTAFLEAFVSRDFSKIINSFPIITTIASKIIDYETSLSHIYIADMKKQAKYKNETDSNLSLGARVIKKQIV